MNACAPHREYLAALADGETELVPAATIDHVRACANCLREIEAHRLLTAKLRQTADRLNGAEPLPVPSRRRAWLGALAAAVAGVLLGGAVATGWVVLSKPDPVHVAVTAASQPLQIRSSDPDQVARWCLTSSGRQIPAIRLDGMQVVGARMDRVPSTDIVTVVYADPAGARVTVGWLEGQAPAGSGVESKSDDGVEVLLAHSTVGTAVVTGSSSAAMWEVAAAIEAAR